MKFTQADPNSCRLQQRLIEYEQPNDLVAFPTGGGKSRLVMQSKIAPEPYQTAYYRASSDARPMEGF